MTEVIDLSPSMQRRLNFRNELLDGVDFYKVELEDLMPVIERYIDKRSNADKEVIVLGMMWLAKDVVCRFRAHFPEVRNMTDDLASEAVLALNEFVNKIEDTEVIFNRLQKFIISRCTAYINDNRCAFGASKSTNDRRLREGRETEYNFAVEYNDELVGKESEAFELVDMLTDLKFFLEAYRNGEIPITPEMIDFVDSIERLVQVDFEEMRDLVLGHLKNDFGLAEDKLTDSQQSLLEDLIKLGVLF